MALAIRRRICSEPLSFFFLFRPSIPNGFFLPCSCTNGRGVPMGALRYSSTSYHTVKREGHG